MWGFRFGRHRECKDKSVKQAIAVKSSDMQNSMLSEKSLAGMSR